MKEKDRPGAASAIRPLDAEALTWRCEPAELGFSTTDEVPELADVVGQPRAVAAVELGVAIDRGGYNIFALGPPGTGKETLIRKFLAQRAGERPQPPDLCYIHNFDEPHKPKLLQVPAGIGAALRRDMERLVEELRTTLESAFESEEYQARRRVIEEEINERPQGALSEIGERAQADGLALLRTPVGLAFAPAKDGEVIAEEEFKELSDKEQKKLAEKIDAYQDEVQKVLRQIPRWDRERRQRLRELNREVTSAAVGHLIDDVRSRYGGLTEVLEYLEAVQTEVIENARDFVGGQQAGAPAQLLEALQGAGGGPDPLRRYRVNLLVDHSRTAGAPVVFEDHPTYDNLVGRIEHLAQMGALLTDFSLIKPGALHRAHGGYLVLDAHRLLRNPYAWEALKRALLSRRLRIESLGQALSLVSTVSLEPEPLALDVQVVLLGEPLVYYLLCELDPDFDQLFKVAADFDDRMDGDGDHRRSYIELIATLVRKEGFKAFDAAAVARVLERSARLAGGRDKLTARIATVVDLLREADHWAGRAGAPAVTGEHVERAIEAQVYRADRLRERIYEEIERGTIMIDTEGERIGQVNGLSVLSLAGFSFGRPSRITARVRLGQDKLVDIEREVELGGPIHSKGVLILASYLGSRYAPEQPPSLAASLVFEQSYGGVEGDSASSAELFALLSAIAGVAVRQSLAVTGSVNQHGEIQPVGGINEKIEGFFDVCRARGLNGEQGVVIPQANVQHLMLRDDVVAAAREGRFRVYPIRTVDEGIELLTGMPAPDRDEAGQFPEGSFNQRVGARLAELAAIWQSFKAASGEDGEGDGR